MVSIEAGSESQRLVLGGRHYLCWRFLAVPNTMAMRVTGGWPGPFDCRR
ncbi:MAG: hypothetical protein OJF48_004983 [Afipia sp.]|nr:MAG: hypothetical protein OJF48_004983 [Afipia sp.]